MSLDKERCRGLCYFLILMTSGGIAPCMKEREELCFSYCLHFSRQSAINVLILILVVITKAEPGFKLPYWGYGAIGGGVLLILVIVSVVVLCRRKKGPGESINS